MTRPGTLWVVGHGGGLRGGGEVGRIREVLGIAWGGSSVQGGMGMQVARLVARRREGTWRQG